MSVFDIKSWGDVRAFLHVTFPAIAGVLVMAGLWSAAVAPLVVALVLAVSDASLSTANTADGFRKWYYPVQGAVSALLLGLGIFADAQLAPVLALVPIFLGGGVAAANTPTTAGLVSV